MLEKLKQRMTYLAEKTVELAKEAEKELEKIKLSEEERNKRYDICKTCEHFNEKTTQCKICNCIMSVKTYLGQSSCPLKKWTKID